MPTLFPTVYAELCHTVKQISRPNTYYLTAFGVSGHSTQMMRCAKMQL